MNLVLGLHSWFFISRMIWEPPCIPYNIYDGGGAQCHGEATMDCSLSLWFGCHSAFFTTGLPQCQVEATMGYFHVVVTAGARCILHYISEWAATVHCLFLVGLSITISTIQLHAFEYLSSTTLT